ncbi:MAG TPA: CpsB/CapC family capsule biosynthesis tyrosine phosphatase [Gaiellales bacterium]
MSERSPTRSFVDVHAHVVSGFDDGPADDAESDALLDALAAQSVTTVVATPHVDARFPARPDELAGLVSALAERRRQGPDVRSGAEVHPGRLDDVIEAGVGRFTLDGGGTLLVEAASDVPGNVLEHCFRRLEHAGVRTLYAHAERSRALRDDDGLARDLVARGARMQVNAGSLCPHAGNRGRAAWKLVDAGLVSVVASDAHALGLRPPRLAEAADEIARRLGEDAVRALMHENPAALCDGRDAPPLQPRKRAGRSAWLQRIGR